MAYVKQITTTENQTYDIKSRVTSAIPYGECDSTSTSTAFTATVDGLDALYDGACVMLKNGIVTSAADFTINVNNLGAKPCYNNMATGNDITPTAPTRDTTIFNINYTMLFVYSEDIVSGGGWICYRGYDGNTNTIGYQLRTNNSTMPASDTGYRYRLWFTSADGQKWVPANTSTATNATTSRTLNTRPIDPFGSIVYCSTNGTINSGAGVSSTAIWQQYNLTIGYSYVITLTQYDPVYLKCTPQTNGSAVMNTITQTLPSTNDGYIYVFLGIASSTTALELNVNHPVYWHDGTGIRIWNGAAGSSITVDSALSSTSENPVQNKVINTALNGKVDAESSKTSNNITITGTVSNKDGGIDIESMRDSDTRMSAISVRAASSYLYHEDPATDASTSVTANKSAVSLLASEGSSLNTLTVTPTNTFISNVVTPTNSGDAVPKSYVDSAVPTAATASPSMDGTAAVGTSAKYAREDHRHPSDTNKVNTTYSSGTITNTIDSNEYGIYGLTSDSSANTSGTVGTSATGAYLTASNANGFYTLEANTTGFAATYTDGTTFETETIFDFTAMTATEIQTAVNNAWT